MDLSSLIPLSTWFIPIPFMFLYHVKTKKLDFFYVLAPILVFLSYVSIFYISSSNSTFFVDVGFRPELIAFYVTMVCIAFMIFQNKFDDVPQSLSIVVCLTFFAILYWEIPYHIFVVAYRHYIDVAMPLHLLHVFPGLFVWQKINLKLDKINFLLLFGSLLCSSLSVVYLYFIGSDFYLTYENPPDLWLITQITWYIVRTVTFFSLYAVFYRGPFRIKLKKPKKQEEVKI